MWMRVHKYKMLSLILKEDEGHEKALREIKQSILKLNETASFQFISIQLLEIKMGHVKSHIYHTYEDLKECRPTTMNKALFGR